MAGTKKPKVLEHCQIASPTGSVPAPSSIPLTYMDLFFSIVPPVQRLFLYPLPCSTTTFLSSHLPNLKRSLSLALKHFHPLAGNIVSDQDGAVPCIRCSEGDSVALTVAECEDDFDDLASNCPKEAQRFHPLVPLLPFDESKQPVLSVQVTFFPNQGVGIGICVHHGAADGSSSIHFMKAWASICRQQGDDDDAVLPAGVPLPFYDRGVIPDPKGLQKIFGAKLNELKPKTTSTAWDLTSQPGIVRATFVLTRAQLDGVRQWVMAKTASSTRFSTFTLACALVRICVVKAKSGGADDDLHAFAFVPNCRSRIEPPVPPTYFGNCAGAIATFQKRSELLKDDELVAVVGLIHDMIKGVEVGEALSNVETWFEILVGSQAAKPAHVLSIAGSPNMRVYEVDFGWGRARKVEVVSIDRTSAMSLAENGNEEEGGIEIGMVLPANEMGEFAAVFERMLEIHS